jgi:copper chaperone CopZ
MKMLRLSTILFFLITSLFANAQNKKTSFLVNGMCDMCEERIENALDIKGISFASWSQETKMCNVTYNMKKVSEKEIHQLLAKIGHDTQQCKATDEAYNNLHHCCHYKRTDNIK